MPLISVHLTVKDSAHTLARAVTSSLASLPPHLVAMLGGAAWCHGTPFSSIAAGKAGAAISYALGQGAPMIAAVWGVFIWKEFKGADRKTNTLLAVMFLFFIAGLASIIASGGN